jgi:23S rRNA (cytidine2498-2'-O)-methyltransferase
VSGIVVHVRQGFEDDGAKELAHHLTSIGVKSRSMQAITDSAIVVAMLADDDIETARARLKLSDLIFARQLLWLSSFVNLPAEGDRVSVLIDEINGPLLSLSGANAFSGFFFETPDTDSSKELTGFCKSLSRHVENSLDKLKLTPKGKGAAHLPRIHLVMTSNQQVLVTLADVANASPWPMGIPRLRFPPSAPSRSTLKLEEAFHVFLGTEGMSEKLKPGMTAVDLGACPGGWTYQLVKHRFQITAIDNGAIDEKLMDSGLVTHLREDAFTYRPYDTVDWMVCDVVEQPSKITDLMAQWLTGDHCRNTIFNLKLPMKKRFDETTLCLAHLRERCRAAGKPIEIHAKQLYHDRKEITVYVSINTGTKNR